MLAPTKDRKCALEIVGAIIDRPHRKHPRIRRKANVETQQGSAGRAMLAPTKDQKCALEIVGAVINRPHRKHIRICRKANVKTQRGVEGDAPYNKICRAGS